MREKYLKQLNKLNFELNEMGRNISSSIKICMQALKQNDPELARKVIDIESEIKELENQIEKRCIKLIMKQQPVAGDLRIISSALKMITDMQRIGRQSADIAEIIYTTKDSVGNLQINNLISMSEATSNMVMDAIKAYVNMDLELVKKVSKKDDEIDKYFDMVKSEIIKNLKEEKDDSETLINLLMIAKYLERIADHAENIVNWVNYSMTGEHLKYMDVS